VLYCLAVSALALSPGCADAEHCKSALCLLCGDVEKKTLLLFELTLKHKTTGIVAKAKHQKISQNPVVSTIDKPRDILIFFSVLLCLCGLRGIACVFLAGLGWARCSGGYL